MSKDSPNEDLSPIILIGSHRSGTTMLGACMSKHPDVCYWLEPNHVWTHGRYAKMEHDRLVESDADAKTKQVVAKLFRERLDRSGKRRICEKTPSNSLRVPFVREIFPNAKFVHIIRDPRGVIRSNVEKMSKGGYGWKAVVRRMGRTPLWEWPQHLDKMRGEIMLKLFGKRLPIFGPKPPGWTKWLSRSPIELTAFQWNAVTSTALEDGRALGPSHYLEFHYDYFVQEPEKMLRRICEFCDLDPSPAGLMAADIRSERAQKWRGELTDDQLELIKPIVLDTMGAAGFSWGDND